MPLIIGRGRIENNNERRRISQSGNKQEKTKEKKLKLKQNNFSKLPLILRIEFYTYLTGESVIKGRSHDGAARFKSFN